MEIGFFNICALSVVNDVTFNAARSHKFYLYRHSELER